MKYNCLIFFLLLATKSIAQNSKVGDGFGGRLWYEPSKYATGSYSAFRICDFKDSAGGQLYGWGKSFYNEMGIGGNSIGTLYHFPIEIPKMDSVIFFSCGYLMGAIEADHSGWVWGCLNNNCEGFAGEPVNVIQDVVFLDAGSSSLSFIKSDSTVWSLGYNYNGNFGNGIIDPYFNQIPVKMDSVSDAVRVASAHYNTTILRGDSTVWVCGQGDLMGIGFNAQALLPEKVYNLPKIIDIKSNNFGTAALAANGDVYYWGDDGLIVHAYPIKIDSLSNVVAISGCSDGAHMMALDSNQNCYVWGDNSLQATGVPLSLTGWIPSTDPILAENNVIDIMAGESFSYIIRTDSTLYFTGDGALSLDYQYSSIGMFTALNPDEVPGMCEPPIGSNLELPNVFTPNGDGINDSFLFPSDEIEELKCQILNRWGNVVAEFNNPDSSWDGHDLSGNKCSEGTYFFKIIYTYVDGTTFQEHGHITLIR